MEKAMKEIGEIIRQMELVLIFGQQVRAMKVIG
jgi:hypothetical protein